MDYEINYYVGRVIDVNEQSISCKFLRRNPNDCYVWPKNDDIDTIDDIKGLFVGPIKLKGTVPYTIRNLPEAFKAFRAYCKDKN